MVDGPIDKIFLSVAVLIFAFCALRFDLAIRILTYGRSTVEEEMGTSAALIMRCLAGFCAVVGAVDLLISWVVGT
jgi:hypothetical protein